MLEKAREERETRGTREAREASETREAERQERQIITTLVSFFISRSMRPCACAPSHMKRRKGLQGQFSGRGRWKTKRLASVGKSAMATATYLTQRDVSKCFGDALCKRDVR